MGIFSQAKDRLIESTVPAYLNRSYLEPYGSITDFKINTTNRSIDLVLQLKGEAEAIRLNVEEFELIERDDNTFVQLKRVSTSREWLTRAAQDFLVNRPFRLPPEAGRALKTIL